MEDYMASLTTENLNTAIAVIFLAVVMMAGTLVLMGVIVSNTELPLDKWGRSHLRTEHVAMKAPQA